MASEDREAREIAIDRINQSARILQDIKDRAELNHDMYRGLQWDDEIARELADQDKAAIVFNQVLSLINSVSGTEQINRFMPKYRARTIGPQARFADMVNGAVRYMRDQTDAEDEESHAFADCLIGAVGALRFSQDYTENEEGRTMCERIPIFKLWWDWNAQKPNLKDGRWIAEYEHMPKDEAIAQWPEHEDEITRFINSYDDLDASAGSQVRRRIAGDLWYEKDRDEVLCIERGRKRQ